VKTTKREGQEESRRKLLTAELAEQTARERGEKTHSLPGWCGLVQVDFLCDFNCHQVFAHLDRSGVLVS
jgi:hypothetical protein